MASSRASSRVMAPAVPFPFAGKVTAEYEPPTFTAFCKVKKPFVSMRIRQP